MATLFALPASAQAASYVVNSIGDAPDATLDGTCATAGSVCTLRAALQESNNSASHDTIAFALPNPSTIDLTGVLPFDFDADITGPGSTALTVRRSSGGNYRIITVAGDLRISGLTVTNGHDDGVGGGLGPVAIGGGILNAAHLVLDDVTVTGNTADFASAVVNAPAIGGGIGNTGTLTVTRSTISHNSAVATASGASNAASGVGGGIGSADLGAGAPSLDVTASTIDHNTVTAAAPIESGAGGGGIAVGDGTATLTNDTISDNQSTATGEGALALGGGVGVDDGASATITSSTIAFNSASLGASVSIIGSGSARLRNTILSNPAGSGNCGALNPVPGHLASDGFNLISDASCGFGSPGDEVGVDPQLAPLGNYGGPTATREILSSSPAIDSGNAAAAGPHPAVTTDQRGLPRPVDLLSHPDGPGSDHADIGAFEFQPPVYGAAVLNAAPAGYWRFDEPSGTVLTDQSTHHSNGTYLGGVTLGILPSALGSTELDSAASFDGVNDSGRVPDSPSLDVGSSFSVEGWIKRSSTSKAHELFNKGANGLQLVVMAAANGNQVWLRRAGVTTIARSAGGVPADGQYHHVVATMNGAGTARIYIDGVLDTVQVSPANVISDTAFPLTFGGAGSTQADYDEFALYDQVLTPAEVLEHFDAARGILPP